MVKKMGEGGAAIIVKDPSFRKFDETEFKRFLDNEGFEKWYYSKNFETTWVYVNINSKTYAKGMPGINVTAHLGHHAITIEEFKTIYNIYKKYEGLSVLVME